MTPAQIILNGLFALMLLVIGLASLLVPNRIQATVLALNRPLQNVPIIGFIAYRWVRSPSYIVFLRAFGTLLVAVGALLLYIMYIRT